MKNKNKFCLRTHTSLEYMPVFPSVIILVFVFGIFLYIRDWKVFLAIQLPATVFAVSAIYVGVKSVNERFHIDGNNVYVAGWCSYKIDTKTIKGIKIMHMHVKFSSPSSYVPQHYKNGRPIYLMILLREIIPEMYNFKQNDYMFSFSFGKYIIAKVEYNPDAIKYLKTLNPDIKVFY